MDRPQIVQVKALERIHDHFLQMYFEVEVILNFFKKIRLKFHFQNFTIASIPAPSLYCRLFFFLKAASGLIPVDAFPAINNFCW